MLFPVCYSNSHDVDSRSDKQHFIWEEISNNMEEVAEAHSSLHLSKCHIVGNHPSRLKYRNKEILWISCHVFRVCTANIVGTDQTYSGPCLSCFVKEWNRLENGNNCPNILGEFDDWAIYPPVKHKLELIPPDLSRFEPWHVISNNVAFWHE